ncbi:uncharacterized protein [Mytilus edulis]|uniref:uncharacterized protein n=1 Tax=Mytilus edulis TaxID=6550 RepID=UPI0039F0FBD4
MKGIEYPVSIKDIPKVEKQNNLSINVFALEDQTKKQSLHPVYISNVEKIYKPQYFSYVGDDAVETYVEKVMKIFKEITYKIYLNEKKKPILNNHEEDEFQEATGCYICGEEFKESEKVREHNHLSGKYRGAACQSCNTKEGKATKLIPVFLHNGSNYDFHFLIEELMKYEDEYNKVKLLSKNSENYISIDYGSNYKKLRCLDLYRFMLKGLSDISKSMDEFPILEKEFKGNIALLKQKGFYPYEYIDSIKKFEDKKLPEIEFFYSKLKKETITKEEYKHAQRVWEHYNCKTLLDYHNLYLKTDVLILADAFVKFRKFFIKYHEIDQCYCYSAPGLTWQCGLKYTEIKLELLTDVDMLQMFEKGIRGGFSGVLGPRHVKAFNKYTSNHNEDYRIIDEHEEKECLELLKEGKNLNKFKKKNYLLYLDANNLYGLAMSQKLPEEDFKWEKDPNYYKKIPKGRGCLIECDLKYTKKCKNKTTKYPLAPEKMKIKKEKLSDYQLNLLGDKPIGQAILDYSKQLMYSFYYDVANELWEKNELVASDTDSMILNIKTKDIYKDMEEIIDELDTSGYPKDHPLYSEKNKKVIGKFKDELNGKIMNEIVFLKSKAYSFTLTDLSEEKN